MKAEHRMLLAIAASVAIFYVWYTWIAPPTPPAASVTAPAPVAPATTTGVTESLPATVTVETGSTVIDPQAQVAMTMRSIDTGKVVVELTSDGARPQHWALSQYLTGSGDETAPIDLVSIATPALALRLDGLNGLVPAQPRFTEERLSDRSVRYTWRSDALEIAKTYAFREHSYLADITIAVTNRTSAPLQGRIGLGWGGENPRGEEHTGFFSFLRPPSNMWSPVFSLAGEIERIKDASALQVGLEREGQLVWAGLENRYFLAALLPSDPTGRGLVRSKQAPLSDGATQVRTDVFGAPLVIPAGGTVQNAFTLYAGPKKRDELKTVGGDLARAIDFGFFSVVAVPILHALNIAYRVVHNYGIAIILLTIFIKLLLHPVTKASLKSMRRMQQLQPQIKALRDKFKDNRERLNTEMMQLFRTNKVNPMGGCLPMLLQIPVYIALYQVLWNSVELYRAPFFWFYTDLSAPDPYFISPILLGIAFFLQQKFTPTPTADPTQRKMMMIMPVMFTAFMFFLPSGLVLYILVNTSFSAVQQWLMNRGRGFRDLLRGKISARAI